jgi:hypothetical protein
MPETPQSAKKYISDFNMFKIKKKNRWCGTLNSSLESLKYEESILLKIMHTNEVLILPSPPPFS